MNKLNYQQILSYFLIKTESTTSSHSLHIECNKVHLVHSSNKLGSMYLGRIFKNKNYFIKLLELKWLVQYLLYRIHKSRGFDVEEQELLT